MNTCLVCNCEFKPSQHSDGKYCSQKCYHSQPKKVIPFEVRFWRYVEKGPNCWLWTGSDDGDDGYGRIKMGNRTIGAHRASWIIHSGDIPKGLEVCHKCDNPPCVRPDHLFLGTSAENQLDSWAKGRRKAPDNRGSRHGMSKLTEDAVREIRRLYIPFKRGNRASIAAKFNVSVAAINLVLWNQRWTHVK